MVPQDDDTVDPLLTVEEALNHSARLRLSNQTSSERHQEIEAALSVLSLQNVRHQLVGTGSTTSGSTRGVSGGQRKRVNIGIELVAKPSILLLDEPTSGLDSNTAASVVEALQRIAHDKGVTVIATIHQPSQLVFQKFDTLVLLVGGRIAYWGAASDAARHLHSVAGLEQNPNVTDPDSVLDLVSNTSLSVALADTWDRRESGSGTGLQEGLDTSGDQSSLDSSKSLKRKLHRSMPWPHVQLLVQLWRQCLRTSRTLVSSTLISCLVFAIIGVFLGLAFTEPKYVLPVPSEIVQWCPGAVNDLTIGQKWQQPCNSNWPSSEVQGLVAMYISMGIGTVSAAFSVWTLGGDRHIYWREARSGSNTVCYYIAANLLDGIKSALFALFFTSAYFLVASPYGSFGDYYLLCYCFILVNFGIGYLASALFEPSNAAIVATLTSLVIGVTSGFVFQYTPFWPWYFGEGLWRSEADYVVQHASKSEMFWVTTYADEQYGYHVGDSTIQHDNLMLLAYAGAFRLVAYVLMRLRHYSKHT